MQLRLATYNIHRCIGTDRIRDPKRTGRVLQQINPDIAALQEVEYVNTVEELGFTAENLGYHALPGPTVTTERSNYGNVLLSRYPVLRVERINLSFPGQEERGAIDADIGFHGATIRVIATHLGLAPVERHEQTQKLLQKIDARPKDVAATILMGDINEWFLWGRPLRWIHSYFGRNPSPATFPGRYPLLALDRIWCHPTELLEKLTAHRSTLSRVASDHLPLTATLSLKR